jgi:hypothetical protein
VRLHHPERPDFAVVHHGRPVREGVRELTVRSRRIRSSRTRPPA